MTVVLRYGPIEVYDDPKLGKWFRRKQGWTGGGFAQIFKPNLTLVAGQNLALSLSGLLRPSLTREPTHHPS